MHIWSHVAVCTYGFLNARHRGEAHLVDGIHRLVGQLELVKRLSVGAKRQDRGIVGGQVCAVQVGAVFLILVVIRLGGIGLRLVNIFGLFFLVEAFKVFVLFVARLWLLCEGWLGSLL